MQLTLWHLYYWRNRILSCEVKNNFPLSEAEFPLCTLQNTYRTVQYIISKHIIIYSEDTVDSCTVHLPAENPC